MSIQRERFSAAPACWTDINRAPHFHSNIRSTQEDHQDTLKKPIVQLTMLQRNCILALFSLILCHHVNSRSIPTGRPTTTATSSVPATTISHPTSTTLATPTPHTSTTLATPIPHTQDCTVYIPQGLQASLLESSCIRDGFSDARSSLKQLSLEQPEQPVSYIIM